MKIWIALLAVFVLDCEASPIELKGKEPSGSITTYDQRQTGKYNVHVNIKDVQVFSISDSLAGIGGDYESEYGDYALLEGDDGGSDYDISHLTVNPIFAFLGSKPTTPKPSTSNATTSVKPDDGIATTSSTTTEKSVSQEQQQLSHDSSTPMTTTTTTTIKQDIESEASAPVAEAQKPQTIPPVKVNETIDYEEIPVEVLYYRNQQQQQQQNKLRKEQQPVAQRRVDSGSRLHHSKRRPSVVIIDTHGRNSNNVKILDDHPIEPMVKICGATEFRDKSGRCRSKYHRQLKRRDANHLPGGL